MNAMRLHRQSLLRAVFRTHSCAWRWLQAYLGSLSALGVFCAAVISSLQPRIADRLDEVTLKLQPSAVLQTCLRFCQVRS